MGKLVRDNGGRVYHFIKVQVEFNKMPSSIIVKSEDGKTFYKKINSEPKKVVEDNIKRTFGIFS